MRNSRRISLNLASQPLRNRRVFKLLFGLLACGLVFIAGLAIFLFIRYWSQGKAVKGELAKIDASMNVLLREQRQLDLKNTEAAKKFRGRVDFVNGLILKKSFSWTGLFSKLENSLPDSSYITSLTPTFKENSTVELRFKVVSQNLNTLLEFITNLQALKFSQIRFVSSDKNERDEVVSEISLSYEGNPQ